MSRKTQSPSPSRGRSASLWKNQQCKSGPPECRKVRPRTDPRPAFEWRNLSPISSRSEHGAAFDTGRSNGDLAILDAGGPGARRTLLGGAGGGGRKDLLQEESGNFGVLGRQLMAVKTPRLILIICTAFRPPPGSGKRRLRMARLARFATKRHL